jgi:hypothetical protein
MRACANADMRVLAHGVRTRATTHAKSETVRGARCPPLLQALAPNRSLCRPFYGAWRCSVALHLAQRRWRCATPEKVRFTGIHAHNALLVVEGSTGGAATQGACAAARAALRRGLRARRWRRKRVPTCGVGLPEQCRERFERRHRRGTARLHACDRVRLAARRHTVRLKR